MNITYKEIVDGYILKEGDTLVLHGIKYTVILSRVLNYYYLQEENYDNNLVFRRLGIQDKQDYCEGIVGKGSVFADIFPDIDTLENLTKIVKALYEHSPYKVGDKVRLVSNFEGVPWINDGMLKYAGQTVTIKSIELRQFSDVLNGDPHAYGFEKLYYTWPSQAIECKIMAETKESDDKTSEESQPKTVSRLDLERGYILKPNDVIYIADIMHKVHPSHFLTTTNLGNFDIIFKILGLNIKEKEAWASKFGCKLTGQMFPSFDTYEDLTKFVLDIFRKYDEFEKSKSSPAVIGVTSLENAVHTNDTSSVPYHKIREDVRPDCHFNNKPIIINNLKSKTKTIIKL